MSSKKQKDPKDMNLVERCKAPTPKFFKIIRTIGLVLAAIGATIMGAPVVLPAALVTASGYILLAGTVATAVSQAAVDGEECDPKKNE